MKRTIRIGSRESKLAISQSMIVIDAIKKHHPTVEIEIVTMKTTGDMILDKSLDKIGGKGLFVKELDLALLDGRIDLAVHSLKDMPMDTPEELPILALTEREDERDVLILSKGCEKWDRTKPVGCSSFRRRIQLQRLYPGIEVKGVRGNIVTRLEKLDSGEFGALVLAAAGIKRLNLDDRIFRYFEIEEILPAAGQGVLAVQGLRNNMEEYTKCLSNAQVNLIAKCEREFVGRLDGGCSSPVAAYGELKDGIVVLRGLYYDEKKQDYCIGLKRAAVKDAAGLGVELADELRKRGV